MAELFRIFKMTLPDIFSILNNVSIRINICLNFRMFTRENKPLFWQSRSQSPRYPCPAERRGLWERDWSTAISYPESSGFLVSGRAPVETLG